MDIAQSQVLVHSCCFLGPPTGNLINPYLCPVSPSFSAINKLNELLLLPSRPYVGKEATIAPSTSSRPADVTIKGVSIPMKYDPPPTKVSMGDFLAAFLSILDHMTATDSYCLSALANEQPQVIRPRETHAMLKVLKAIDTQSQRQALHDQKPSSDAPPDEAKRNSKAKVQKVVEFLDRSVESKR